MRIGLVTACYRPVVNGVTRILALYQKYLPLHGHEVTVFTLGQPQHNGAEPGVVRSPAIHVRGGYYYSPRYGRAAQARLRQMDIVHCHHMLMGRRPEASRATSPGNLLRSAGLSPQALPGTRARARPRSSTRGLAPAPWARARGGPRVGEARGECGPRGQGSPPAAAQHDSLAGCQPTLGASSWRLFAFFQASAFLSASLIQASLPSI